jgi:hypothetical protein
MIELLPFGDRIRRGATGGAERGGVASTTQGPVGAARFTWGDVFTAHHSTGIPTSGVRCATARHAPADGDGPGAAPLFSFAPVRA